MFMILTAIAVAGMPSPSLEAAIKEAVGKDLADPYSAQYVWQPIRNDVLYCGWVNAKNRLGAYTGYRPFMVLYAVNTKSGKARVLSADLEPHVVTPMCLEKGYRLTR